MYDDFKDRRRKDMWKAFPPERLEQLRRSIRHMNAYKNSKKKSQK